MAVEWRKCNKLSWALCDGNCSGCNTFSTSFTINPPSPSIKHGHWIGKEDQKWHCSECDGIAPKGYRYNYCPHCGARMDGERREDVQITDNN